MGKKTPQGILATIYLLCQNVRKKSNNKCSRGAYQKIGKSRELLETSKEEVTNNSMQFTFQTSIFPRLPRN